TPGGRRGSRRGWTSCRSCGRSFERGQAVAGTRLHRQSTTGPPRGAAGARRIDLTRPDGAATLRPATAPREVPDSEDLRPRVTASELAFLALGLLLGAALGAAALVTLGSRPNKREIRVTVTHDALPRRSGTLSHDAFVTSPGEIARGGPGDRRRGDRAPDSRALTPVMAAAASPVGDLGAPSFFASEPRPRQAPNPAPAAAPARTIVPYVAGSVGVEIRPDADPLLDDLRVPPTRGSLLERMLRGEHRAMVEAVDRIAGEDSRRRRDWELLLGGLIEAMGEVAVEESVIDFPMGTSFWDTFTVAQCRRVVGALATMGYRYDGHS